MAPNSLAGWWHLTSHILDTQQKVTQSTVTCLTPTSYPQRKTTLVESYKVREIPKPIYLPIVQLLVPIYL